MADIEIIYRTKAELAGAVAVQQSLEKQIGAAKALGKEYAAEDAQLQKVNVSLKQHAQATVNAAEASAKFFQEAARDAKAASEEYWKLKKSTEEAGGGIGKVGSALSSIGAPLLSATALAAAAVAAFSQWNEVLAATGIAQQNFAPGANSFATAARSMQDMVDRAMEFNEALRLQETNFGRVEAASGRAISAIAQNTAAQRQALDAEKVLAEARLELRRQTDPNFSEADFQASRRGLRAGFRQRSRGLEVGEVEADLKVKQSEFNEMMKQGRDAERDKPALEAKLQAALDKQKGLAITGPRDTADLSAEMEKNKKKMAFIDAIRSGASPVSITGQPLHRQFGLSELDMEEMRASGITTSGGLDARNRQIQSTITDKIPRASQAAAAAVADAQSKLADANRNIAATRPGATYDAKTGEISSLLAQKQRLTGTLAGSQANLDKAADTRELAATIQEEKQGLKSDTEEKKRLIKSLGAAGRGATDELVAALERINESVSRHEERLKRLGNQVAETMNQ